MIKHNSITITNLNLCRNIYDVLIIFAFHPTIITLRYLQISNCRKRPLSDRHNISGIHNNLVVITNSPISKHTSISNNWRLHSPPTDVSQCKPVISYYHLSLSGKWFCTGLDIYNILISMFFFLWFRNILKQNFGFNVFDLV